MNSQTEDEENNENQLIESGSQAQVEPWRGLSMRLGDRIVPALPEDVAVAMRYQTTAEKGPIVGGQRRTILAAKIHYQVGEEIRVIHVHEIVETGHQLLIMGPKPVYGEYVDDRLVTERPPLATEYDGAVLESPNIDYNYDITSYRFSSAGSHRIYWQPDEVRSNTLELEIATD